MTKRKGKSNSKKGAKLLHVLLFPILAIFQFVISIASIMLSDGCHTSNCAIGSIIDISWLIAALLFIYALIHLVSGLYKNNLKVLKKSNSIIVFSIQSSKIYANTGAYLN